MPLPPGARLGPYEIVSSLGAGGMGDVYRARDTRLHRDVALKVLPELFAADPDRRRRFEQEARAVAALNHPHICQIYDVGPDYLVLELVDGADLHGPQPEKRAARIALQIADALQTAHARGILHRDLKPSNVVVTAEGVAKLLDFGIAKLDTPSRDVTMTASGTVLGTAAYMSPEQAQGRRSTRAATSSASVRCSTSSSLAGVHSRATRRRGLRRGAAARARAARRWARNRAIVRRACRRIPLGASRAPPSCARRSSLSRRTT